MLTVHLNHSSPINILINFITCFPLYTIPSLWPGLSLYSSYLLHVGFFLWLILPQMSSRTLAEAEPIPFMPPATVSLLFGHNMCKYNYINSSIFFHFSSHPALTILYNRNFWADLLTSIKPILVIFFIL